MAHGQVPAPAATASPNGLEGLVWNKWDTENFVVISLDKGFGLKMRSEAERARSGLAERWRLTPPPGSRCKLVCVPDALMLKRLFGLSEPKCEVKKSESGGTESAIWIDAERADLLPSLLAEEELASGKFSDFVRVGVPALERSPSYVRESLLSSKDAATTDLTILCLLVRKELGGRVFAKAASADGPVHVQLGFGSEDEMKSTLARYKGHLLEDLKSGRTPDEYLGVRP